MKLLILLSFIVFNTARATDCVKNPIYCSIKVLKPRINKSFAFKLSNIIHKYSRKYRIQPKYSIAIIMQETSFRNINANKDIGLFQINQRTAYHYGINIERLQKDLDYATKSHFRILKKKINVCKSRKLSSPWKCYHSYTPSKHNKYKRDVIRHLRKIEKFFRKGK